MRCARWLARCRAVPPPTPESSPAPCWNGFASNNASRSSPSCVIPSKTCIWYGPGSAPRSPCCSVSSRRRACCTPPAGSGRIRSPDGPLARRAPVEVDGIDGILLLAKHDEIVRVGQADVEPAAGHLLPASPVPASALRTVRLHDEVADLGPEAVGPTERLSVDDDPAAAFGNRRGEFGDIVKFDQTVFDLDGASASKPRANAACAEQSGQDASRPGGGVRPTTVVAFVTSGNGTPSPRRHGMAQATAEGRVRMARALGEMPGVAGALSRAEISTAAADALVRAREAKSSASTTPRSRSTADPALHPEPVLAALGRGTVRDGWLQGRWSPDPTHGTPPRMSCHRDLATHPAE